MSAVVAKIALPFLGLALLAGSARAEVIRKECQTTESRGLRLTAEAMNKAASESEPHYPSCPSGQMCMFDGIPQVQENAMKVTADRFRSEATASLLKARAIEATKCAKWERAIMEDRPATDKEKQDVAAEFDRLMQVEWAKLAELKKWQIDHPQCKHVEVTSSQACSSPPGTCKDASSKEDFSGHVDGKAGECSADGHASIWWRGSGDDLTAYNPDTNSRIAEIQCADALKKFNFGNGWMSDPKNCAH